MTKTTALLFPFRSIILLPYSLIYLETMYHVAHLPLSVLISYVYDQSSHLTSDSWSVWLNLTSASWYIVKYVLLCFVCDFIVCFSHLSSHLLILLFSFFIYQWSDIKLFRSILLYCINPSHQIHNQGEICNGNEKNVSVSVSSAWIISWDAAQRIHTYIFSFNCNGSDQVYLCLHNHLGHQWQWLKHVDSCVCFLTDCWRWWACAASLVVNGNEHNILLVVSGSW